jgi:hypothetical protein
VLLAGFFDAEVFEMDFVAVDFVVVLAGAAAPAGVLGCCVAVVVALVGAFTAASPAELWRAPAAETHAQANNSAQPARNTASRTSVQSFNMKPSP